MLKIDPDGKTARLTQAEYFGLKPYNRGDWTTPHMRDVHAGRPVIVRNEGDAGRTCQFVQIVPDTPALPITQEDLSETIYQGFALGVPDLWGKVNRTHTDQAAQRIFEHGWFLAADAKHVHKGALQLVPATAQETAP